MDSSRRRMPIRLKFCVACAVRWRVYATLDLNMVLPDSGAVSPVFWIMLYRAGYLTIDEAEHAGSMLLTPYCLRIPNREISMLFKCEIIDRFVHTSREADCYHRIHQAPRVENVIELSALPERVLEDSTSFYDMLSENSSHMFITGLYTLYLDTACRVSTANLAKGDLAHSLFRSTTPICLPDTLVPSSRSSSSSRLAESPAKSPAISSSRA